MEAKVKLYTLSTCSHCKSTKKLLDECSVQYECTEVDMLPAAHSPPSSSTAR
jgi:glutaredoxin-like protein NrdH